MGSEKKHPVENTIGYIEVFQRDEDDYYIFNRRYYDNLGEAMEDLLTRTYVPLGDHNECFLVGRGPAFGHIRKKRTVYLHPWRDVRLDVEEWEVRSPLRD